MNGILIGLKKFATTLPDNWLAGTHWIFALMRLGRQSAERERISENNWNFFGFFSSMIQTLIFSTVLYTIENL
ncbi:hypothetical protein OCO53_00665 [Peribacillus frigoritolerans]|uniref:hypothetical protein n=1 Tax=Peribacillus frigoritolerans TaxID=450367 RepID=UPI0021CFDA25|nr:hypothetical protein [Peribacillus frigoritolerans]MCU6598987.1 hypothetical protein [Peribacillus frigoritolerans]